MDIKVEHIVILALLGLAFGWWSLPGVVKREPVVTDACLAGCGGISSTSAEVGAVNYVNGTKITAGASNEFFNTQDKSVKASVTIDAYPDSISGLPTCFNGYLMTGDDDGTAPDYYFTKTADISWGCTGTYRHPTDVKVAEESSVTFTGYDDGTSEATWNITVGTSKVTSSELKIASDSDKCIGNPTLPNPIMVCVNGSSSTLSKFNEINPTGISKSGIIPGFLSDETTVKGCYILPTNALCDGAEDRRYWTIDPVSDPGVTDKVSICLIDKTYYVDDNNVYQVGWEDVSAFTSNADIGIDLTCKDLHFT